MGGGGVFFRKRDSISLSPSISRMLIDLSVGVICVCLYHGIFGMCATEEKSELGDSEERGWDVITLLGRHRQNRGVINNWLVSWWRRVSNRHSREKGCGTRAGGGGGGNLRIEGPELRDAVAS